MPAKLTPADMAPEERPVGELCRTRFARVQAGVWLIDTTTALVFCFGSVAGCMFTLLGTVADAASAVAFHAKQRSGRLP